MPHIIHHIKSTETTKPAIEIVQPNINNGIEFYTSPTTSQRGVSQVGLSKLAGVDERTIRSILEVINSGQSPSTSLDHLVGANLYLDLTSRNNAKVVASNVAASLISYYAVERKNKTALFSLQKFATVGFDGWVDGILKSYQQLKDSPLVKDNSNPSLVGDSKTSTLELILEKVNKLEQLELETIGYRKAVGDLPVLERWMNGLDDEGTQKLLAPTEELFTIKEGLAQLFPGITFSETIHRKIALKMSQIISGLSGNPMVKKEIPNKLGYTMVVNGYYGNQLYLMKLVTQTIAGV